MAFANALSDPGPTGPENSPSALGVAEIPVRDPLRFSFVGESSEDLFFREGPVSAHLNLRSGAEARVIAAFPAGNSGTSLWFESKSGRVNLAAESSPVPVSDKSGNFGIRVSIRSDVSRLAIKDVMLGTLRAIRDYAHHPVVPPLLRAGTVLGPRSILWRRSRLDGACDYIMRLDLEGGFVERDGTGLAIGAESGNPLRFTLTCLTGETPLRPLPCGEILKQNAFYDPQMSQVLSFLCYEEGFLAGSWQYLSYFGRDTLITLQLLMEVLKPNAVTAGFSSVLNRIDRRGSVAHEEELGEFAFLQRLALGEYSAEPRCDYHMVDDDFILAPVMETWLLHTEEGKTLGHDFLERSGRIGSYRQVLELNLRYVMERARAFASSGLICDLVPLKDGHSTGDWRDSGDGLGGGRYSYSVNAVFVPAALKSCANLLEAGICPEGEGLTAELAKAYWGKWSKVTELFEVSGTASPQERFSALSLREDGRPVPVLHSDVGFHLLFTEPPATEVMKIIHLVMRPYPEGLRTPVGLVVANPNPSQNESLIAMFDRNAYHGCVIWSWQQAVMLAGFRRQARRIDLDPDSLCLVRRAVADLENLIASCRSKASAELWAWAVKGDQWFLMPFGQEESHSSEANAAQLWSTVYLGVLAD